MFSFKVLSQKGRQLALDFTMFWFGIAGGWPRTFLEVLVEEVRGEGAAYQVSREPEGPHQVDGGGRGGQVVGQVRLHRACSHNVGSIEEG